MTTSEFIEYFASFGKVRSFLLPPDPRNKKSNCGYGFINYRDSATLKKVIAQAKHVLRAKELDVQIAKPRNSKSPNAKAFLHNLKGDLLSGLEQVKKEKDARADEDSAEHRAPDHQAQTF